MTHNATNFDTIDHTGQTWAERNGGTRIDAVSPAVLTYELDGVPQLEARCIIEENSGKMLNPFISPAYDFMPYQDRFSLADRMLEDSGLAVHNKLVSYDFPSGGGKAFRQTVLPDYTKTMRGDDTTSLRLLEWDSVDGSSPYILRAGWYSWVCANTCVAGEDIANQRHTAAGRKRTKEIDPQILAATQAATTKVRYAKTIEAIKHAVGVYETATDGLKELVDMRVQHEHETLDFLGMALAGADKKKGNALAEHLHGNWAQHRKDHDNTWYDFSSVLTDYAARGRTNNPELTPHETRLEREQWVGVFIPKLAAYARGTGGLV